MLNIEKLENGNSEIIVPKGVRYISEWKDYCLDAFPFKHILDKKIPGCGFTEYCLTGHENVILCSPRRILLENKEMQHQDSVLYFKNELDEDSAVDKDISKVTKASVTPEEKQELDRIKRQQILEDLESQLNRYYTYCTFKNIPCKILVTYDSFRLVKQFLGERIKYFYTVIDEFQSIFVDSRFKSDTELGFIYQLRDINRVCFVSATPYIDEYLKQVDEFKDLPYYELNWEKEDPFRVVKPDLKVRVTKSIQMAAEKIISSYKSGDFATDVNKDRVITSTEAVIYVNSVTNIISIIKKCELKPEECNILCANTPYNELRIKKRLGKDFEIGKVPLKGAEHKMFTFCTRTVYLGADFYSTCARSFILSDANIDSLAVDITLDLPQILGRQRLLDNPWKNRAELYYKTLREGKKMSREEFDEFIQDKLERTESLLRSYGSALDIDKHNLAVEYQKLAKTFNYKDHYVAVNIHAGNSLLPVLNKLVLIAEQRAFDIQQVDYKDRFTVFNTLSEGGYIEGTAKSKVYGFIDKFDELKTFPEKMKFLCESEFSDVEIGWVLDQIPLQYKNYYETLGPERLKACGYNVTRVKKEYESSQVDISDLPNKILSAFEVGNKYLRSDVKDLLGDIYDSFGYAKTPKASDLEEYFVIRSCQITNKDTGKRENGFEIIKKKD